MDKYQAARAWGVTPEYARIMMRIMPEAKRIISDRGNAVWVVPMGTPKPDVAELKRRKGEK